MLSIILITLCAAANAAPRAGDLQLATPCTSECVLPDCRCMSTSIPNNLDPSTIPQMVLLTFDDAITVTNFPYYEEALFSRTNPDGCPVAATYFMSHEYTDYSKVHELHARGHEIALHSITHTPITTYWDELSVEGYVDEFGGERTIIANFADIPEDDVKGMRIPLLQLAGNKSFHAAQIEGLQYDCTWPTQTYSDPPLWPYTLDYSSNQDCTIGACPTASFPGLWVQPMVTWEDNAGYVCSMVDSCTYIPSDVSGLVEFMKRNFHRHYDSNRAPFGFYVHAAWFQADPLRYEAYLQFLDYLQSLSDVYIVGIQRALEWVQNPKPLNELSSVWTDCQNTYEPTCKAKACALPKGEETRYMTQCKTSCPKNYPWLGNPLGA